MKENNQSEKDNYVVYIIKGIEYGYPKIKRTFTSCLDNFDTVYEETDSLNEFYIRCKAWVESCMLSKAECSKLSDEIIKYGTEAFETDVLNIVSEIKLDEKKKKLTQWMEKKSFKFTDEPNDDMLETFITDALQNGASYSKIISWMPKFKKIKAFMKDPSKGEFDEYNQCVEKFYKTNNLYKENVPCYVR